MAITFRDFEHRKYLCRLELVCGEGGLDKSIVTANILDYEFSIENEIVNPFEHESIILSSLLFAKDNPALIFPAVKKLLELNVSGMAFETAVYKKLPPEVVEFANQNDFPIFSFDRELMIENIIYEIMDAVQNEDAFILSEKRIDKAINGELSNSEITAIKNGLSLKFMTYAEGVYIHEKNNRGELQGGSIFKSRYLHKELRKKHILFKYKDGIFMLSTLNSGDSEKFKIAIGDALEILDIDADKMYISYSGVHNSADQLDLCMKESYYAGIAARIEGRSQIEYNNIGMYKWMIPHIHTHDIEEYTKEYLSGISNKEDLMETAVDFVLSGGDLFRVAEKHICHVNTIRYRLNRIKKLTGDENRSDIEFYVHLFITVKLFLLCDSALHK